MTKKRTNLPRNMAVINNQLFVLPTGILTANPATTALFGNHLFKSLW